MRTDDPIYDFGRHEEQAERWLRTRPICCECGTYIQDEECYEFDGRLICSACLEENHLHYID